MRMPWRAGAGAGAVNSCDIPSCPWTFFLMFSRVAPHIRVPVILSSNKHHQGLPLERWQNNVARSKDLGVGLDGLTLGSTITMILAQNNVCVYITESFVGGQALLINPQANNNRR